MFVKICGTTSEEDALLAVAMGADAVGFIFAPSTRQIAPAIARDIVKRLPPEILTVGVFRDEAPQRVIDVMELRRPAGRPAARPGAAGADPLAAPAPAVRGPGVPGRRPRGARTHATTAPTPSCSTTRRRARARCSTGRWPARCPTGLKLIIAGGLTPDNVGGAVGAVRPWGVDVVTGVEREPGHKDPIKMRAFVAAARAAEAAAISKARATTCRTTGRRSHDAAPSAWPNPGPAAASASSAGRYVPESLMPACSELEAAFRAAWSDPDFLHALRTACCEDYAGRPTPVTECRRLSEQLGVRLLLKREDLTHTGSHKINNVLGQGLLTLAMGKSRMVAETGAGQHGVATATAAALFGLRVRGLHGRGGHRAPGPQRVPDAAARRRGANRALGQPDAQGRGQRGPAGLGGFGGQTPTTAWDR